MSGRRSRPDEGQGCGMRVLILEDDPFIALDLQGIVESEGHQVVGVHRSLAEARKRLADAFEFALLDIDVLDGKSFELASALDDLPARFRDAHFVAKPYNEAAIVRLLPAAQRTPAAA